MILVVPLGWFVRALLTETTSEATLKTLLSNITALRTPTSPNDPGQPQLGPPPTPMGQESYLSLAPGFHSFLELCWRGAGLQLGPSLCLAMEPIDPDLNLQADLLD